MYPRIPPVNAPDQNPPPVPAPVPVEYVGVGPQPTRQEKNSYHFKFSVLKRKAENHLIMSM